MWQYPPLCDSVLKVIYQIWASDLNINISMNRDINVNVFYILWIIVFFNFYLESKLVKCIFRFNHLSDPFCVWEVHGLNVCLPKSML